jgi:hypothetical protein
VWDGKCYMSGGRYTILTPEVQAEICAALEEGNTLKCSALCAGVSESTVMIWRRKGREGIEPYAQFLQATKEAESRIERKMISGITSADDWRAKLSWVERRRSKDWWLTRPGRGEAKDAGKMSDEELRVVLQAALEKLTAK